MDAALEIQMMRRAADIAGLRPAAIVLPLDHQLILGKLRFHYLDWGGSGAPIVLLHGGGLNAHTWDLVALMLREQYRCIALDQRGHGDSEWSSVMDYGVETQSRDIEQFIEALGIQDPVVVGQSMGGLNALAYATRHHDRMKGLIVVDVGPEINAAGAQRIREFASTPEQDSLDAFLERAVKFNRLRNPEVLRRSLYYNLRETPAGKWSLKHDQRRSSDEVAQIGVEQRTRIAREIPGIGCPVLIARGELSDILTREAAERFARSLRRGRWVEVANAGHNVQGDNPAGLLEAIRPFLEEIGHRR